MTFDYKIRIANDHAITIHVIFPSSEMLMCEFYYNFNERLAIPMSKHCNDSFYAKIISKLFVLDGDEMLLSEYICKLIIKDLEGDKL